MGSPDLSAGALGAQGQGSKLRGLAGTGFDSPLSLVSSEAGSLWCERGCACRVCTFLCLCLCSMCVHLSSYQPSEDPHPPSPKRHGLIRKGSIFGRLTVPVSCSGRAAPVLKSRLPRKPGPGKLEASLVFQPESLGRSVTVRSQGQSTCGCGPRAVHRRRGRWEDLEGLRPRVALPCKGRQERNTWPDL